MRKNVLMGLGLAISLASAVAAQQPSDSAHARHRGEGGEMRGRGPGGARGLLFKDIKLTDAQKAQLKQLHETQKSQFEATRDARKKEWEQMRAAREKGDTVAARAIMDKNRQLMEQRRTQDLAAIRNILTADQRVQFDKNVAELQARVSEHGFGRGGRRGGPEGERRGKGADRQG